MSFLLQQIPQNKIHKILEIGTAIGYSALAMSFDNTEIDTLERDYFNYHLAKNFLKPTPFKINVVWAEALIYPLTHLKTYDLIFIDAAKGQYQKLFAKFCQLLNPQGIIICDNIHLSCFQKNQSYNKPKGVFKKCMILKYFCKTIQILKLFFKISAMV